MYTYLATIAIFIWQLLTVSPDATCLHEDPASTRTEHCSRKCCLKISEAQLRNVALNKASVQSTHDPDAPASKAVDGNTNGDFVTYASCTHTSSDAANPWWEVDLGDVYLVEHIVVYNRIDCCAYRLSDVYFDVSNDQDTYRRFYFHEGQIPDIKTITPERRLMSARWVKIHFIGGDALTLCEVQVMAKYRMQKVYYDAGQPELQINVNTFLVPVKATVACIEECARRENDFFMELIDLATAAPYIECYCPI